MKQNHIKKWTKKFCKLFLVMALVKKQKKLHVGDKIPYLWIAMPFLEKGVVSHCFLLEFRISLLLDWIPSWAGGRTVSCLSQRIGVKMNLTDNAGIWTHLAIYTSSTDNHYTTCTPILANINRRKLHSLLDKTILTRNVKSLL